MKAKAKSGEAIHVTSGAEEFVFQVMESKSWHGALQGKAKIRSNLFSTEMEWKAWR